MKTLTLSILFIMFSGPLLADNRVEIKSASDIDDLPAGTTSLYVQASGAALTKITEKLSTDFPNLIELEIFHGANSKGKLTGRPLAFLSKMELLKTFKFTGDPSLSLQDFQDIGALTSLTNMHLSLP